MLARKYVPEDAGALDKLVEFNRAGNVRVDRDQIIVVGAPGVPSGVLAWRPGGIVHEFHCGHGDGLSVEKRLRASALVNFACGDAQVGTFKLYEAIFLVKHDNENLVRYLEELGAVQQEGERVYTLAIR